MLLWPRGRRLGKRRTGGRRRCDGRASVMEEAAVQVPDGAIYKYRLAPNT